MLQTVARRNICNGGWSIVPGYVTSTAGILPHVQSLAAFRLGGHHSEVTAGRWSEVRGSNIAVSVYVRVVWGQA
jgi:hypothetical protein